MSVQAARKYERMEKVNGAAGNVRVAVFSLPYRIDHESGSRRLAYMEYGRDLAKFLFTGPSSIPRSAHTGLIAKSHACRECKHLLSASPAQMIFMVRTSFSDRRFNCMIEVIAPGVVCMSCGCKQMLGDDTTANKVLSAVADAFGSAGVKP